MPATATVLHPPARDRLPQTADQTERFRTRVAGKLRGLPRDRGFDGRLEHRLRRLRALSVDGAHDTRPEPSLGRRTLHHEADERSSGTGCMN